MIEYSKLRSLTARQIIRGLESDGFKLARQKGSHRHYRHAEGRRVTISFHHAAQTFRIATLRSMLERQARWTEGIWLDLVSHDPVPAAHYSILLLGTPPMSVESPSVFSYS